MKQKLKIHLWKTNCTVHMQVLEQEEITENLSDKILIIGCSDLDEEYICLRGSLPQCDYDIVNYLLGTEQKAIDYITKVVSWLDEVFPQKKPKRGDVVLVKDKEDNNFFKKRNYLTTIENADYPYICVSKHSEQDFINGKEISYDIWQHMQPLTTNWNPETGIYEAEREV